MPDARVLSVNHIHRVDEPLGLQGDGDEESAGGQGRKRPARKKESFQ